jgi:hypothetical protein
MIFCSLPEPQWLNKWLLSTVAPGLNRFLNRGRIEISRTLIAVKEYLKQLAVMLYALLQAVLAGL